jgi:hypothetical protein
MNQLKPWSIRGPRRPSSFDKPGVLSQTTEPLLLRLNLITRMTLLLTVAEKSSWGDLSRCYSKNFARIREFIFQART